MHNVVYEKKYINHVLKQKIRRLSRLSQAGNLKEESASGILKSQFSSCARKTLAGESSAQQVEVGQAGGVNFSGV